MQEYSIKSSQNVPLISIIIVTLNAEKFIANTINSILNQDFNSYEIIVIDGQSKDSTLNVLIPFKNRIEKIISEKDKGIYDAMNKGIRYAIGEWVYFLNAGDVFASTYTLSNIFKNNYNSSILYGDVLLKNDNKIIKYPDTINKYFFFSDTICHQSVFFYRLLFLEISNFNIDYKIIADRDFLIRAYNSNAKFTHISEVVSIYDQEGFSAKNSNLYRIEELKLRKKYFSFFDYFKYFLIKSNFIKC